MKRKNRFWNLIFSLIPGAGQMYQGHMKRGVSVMTLFLVVAAVSIFTGIGELCLVLPVVWFFAFFDAINNSNLTEDELQAIEDKPIFGKEFMQSFDPDKLFHGKSSLVLGVTMLIIGAVMLYRSAIDPILRQLLQEYWWEVYWITSKIPVFAIGVVIIIIGVKMIKGSKNK